MKRIYLSDLDGTLFTSKKKLTEQTIRLLNECIGQGTLFAVATARMPYGCDHRLRGLNLNVPSILTNGVFLYDFFKKEYLSVKTIPAEQAHKVIEVFARFHTGMFVYTFEQNLISIHYNWPELKGQTQYYSERALESCKTVALCTQPDTVIEGDNAVYFACTGRKEQLEPIRDAVLKIDGIACAFYLNIYNGLYCIEIFSAQASKKHALLELKALLGCDETVVFGDNLNDLSMIEVADRSYAVENALEDVKIRTTDIIPSCDENGVARFIHKEVFGY